MRRILTILALFGVFTTASLAQGISPQERTRVESIIRDYLLKNPEILQEVMGAIDRAGRNGHHHPDTPHYEFLADEIWQQFVEGMKATPWYEYLAVFAGFAVIIGFHRRSRGPE